ncbi:MAG: FmdB family zinc ribbon protein [Anaerolineae bacterium]|jgi:putative FmdB family regulatory protein|nr:zinc ribbon domain-containing protein [Chloroflexota bacterium]
MPAYDYRCKACAQVFEVFYRSPGAAQRAGAPACPHCGGTDTVKLVSRIAPAVSGGGAQRPSVDAGAAAAGEPTYTPRSQIDSWRQNK